MHAAKLLQSCLSLCDPMDSSLPGSSAHEILQARILEWVATPSPSGSSGPRDWIYTSSISYFGRLGSLPLAPPGKPTQSLYRFLLFLFISLFSKVTVLQISLGVGGGSHLSLIVGSPGGAVNQGTSLAPNEVWAVDLSRHEPGLWILIELKKKKKKCGPLSPFCNSPHYVYGVFLPRLLWKGPHSIFGVYLSLNKSTSYISKK